MATLMENIADHIYQQRFPALDAAFNQRLFDAFLAQRDGEEVRKTHLFEGRYENIYLERDCCSELSHVLTEAQRAAESITGVTGLSVGFWFNEMPPGHRTLPHTHDDLDELLSGVYYVVTPLDSGNLKIDDEPEPLVVAPEPGKMVFFPPDRVHEVEVNASNHTRLSIGMNFGLRDPGD